MYGVSKKNFSENPLCNLERDLKKKIHIGTYIKLYILYIYKCAKQLSQILDKKKELNNTLKMVTQ